MLSLSAVRTAKKPDPPNPNPYERSNEDILECYKLLLGREAELQPKSDFIAEKAVVEKTGRGVTKEKRTTLMIWILEVSESFGLNHCTTGHIVILIDRTLEKVAVMRDLALIALACCRISSKFHEVSPVDVKDLQQCAPMCTKEDICKMEGKVHVYVCAFVVYAPACVGCACMDAYRFSRF
jgi:hypothetical protein